MDTNWIGGLRCRASEPMIAKPTSIKGTGGKSGGCAWKASELTSGELLHVTESCPRVAQFTRTGRQKSAAGVVVAQARKDQTGTERAGRRWSRPGARGRRTSVGSPVAGRGGG